MQNNVFGLLQMLSNIQNPQAFMQQIVKVNPNMQQAYDKVNQIVSSGQNIEQCAKNLLQSPNIDINNLTKMASQFIPHQ